MASLRCPRCSATVEIAGKQPHCPLCNFPYRDSRPAAATPSRPLESTFTPPAAEPGSRRPIGVTLVGGLDVLAGVAILVFGVVLARALLPSLSTNAHLIRALRTGFGSVSIVLGAFAIVQGIGLLRGRGWAWTVQVVLTIWSALSDVVRVGEDALPSVLIACVLVWYFLRPAVRAWFGKTPLAFRTLRRLPA
jgi:hypothetical protein